MRHGAAHKFDVRSTWKLQVIHETCLAGYFCTGIHAAEWFADDLEIGFPCFVVFILWYRQSFDH